MERPAHSPTKDTAMILGGTRPTAKRRTVDAADLIAAHSAGAGEALAEAIREGHGPRVESYPPRRVPPPTPRDEAVGSLFEGYLRLRSGKR